MQRTNWEQFKSLGEARAYVEKTQGIINCTEIDKYLKANMPKEAQIQSKIMAWIKNNCQGAFIWKAAAGVYSRQGVPDICVVYRGTFYGLEVKRPFFGKLTAIQKATLKTIESAGGIAAIVTSVEEAAAVFNKRWE